MSPRTLFEHELSALCEDVKEMVQRTESVYVKLFEALEAKDEKTMQSIVVSDRVINDMQRNIEASCLTLLTRQQPVARDLRMVSAALKVVTDIERVGDHVSDMAELFIRMGMPNLSDFSLCMPDMIEATRKIIWEAVDSFVNCDIKSAQKVIQDDDIIDAYFNQVKSDLILDLKGANANPDDSIDTLMVAKYLEKIGDHAVNIGEWAIFQETGEINDVRIL